MSAQETHPMKKYVEGEDRYINFSRDILGAELQEPQKEILRAVTNHRRLVICSGNGVGKTYAVAALELAFLYTHQEAMVLHTSRSNGHTRNTTYKEIREMHSNARENGFPLEGSVLKTPMEIDFEDSKTRKYEAVSPSNADGLEGRHSENFLAVVDEADKQEITEEVIESAESSLTDDGDRIVVIGNPPRDRGNVMNTLIESEHWHTIRFSSFDCDNVQMELGQKRGTPIAGPIQLSEIKYDWETKHDEEWTTFDDVLSQSAPYIDEDGSYHLFDMNDEFEENDDFREDLSEYWYRRRCGIIPPNSATKPRPFYPSDIAEAEERWERTIDSERQGHLPSSGYDAIGVDVAGRGVDKTVVTGVTRASSESSGRIDVLAEIDGNTETEIAEGIRYAIADAGDSTPIGFDTVGMGGPVADTFRNEGFDVVRFDGSKKAKDTDQYRNQRTEAWDEFGDWLYNGAVRPASSLVKELYGVAEHIEMEEKSLVSGTVYMATSKDELKKADKYGESPDYLDSASIAVWTSNHGSSESDAGWNIYSLN